MNTKMHSEYEYTDKKYIEDEVSEIENVLEAVNDKSLQQPSMSCQYVEMKFENWEIF